MKKNLKFKMKNLKLEQGFTLIEMLIAIVIFAIVSIGLVALVTSIMVSSAKQSSLLAGSDQARKLAANMMNELRNAQVSSVGAYPLAIAESQSIIFYSNIDSDSYIERVRYFIQNNKLYKGILKPSGNPLVYNLANEKLSVAQNDLANGTDPIFYYYGKDYDGSSDIFMNEPVNVTAIRLVKLNLRIFNKAGVSNSNYYTITASASIRNLKDNLGDFTQANNSYSLAASVFPAQAGSVSVSPEGPTYSAQTLVYLTAYANLGYLFSNWTGDVTNPSSATTTIVMNGNKTVIANLNTIPQSLVGGVFGIIGFFRKYSPLRLESWVLRINNPNTYSVNSVNLYSFLITQTSGPACSPILTNPTAFPALIGNIAAGSYRTYNVTINFSNCDSTAHFTANFTFAGNNGADWGSASYNR